MTSKERAASLKAEVKRNTKALVAAIGYPLVHASWPEGDTIRSVVTHMAVQDRDALVASILAAGFTMKGDADA